MELSLMTYNIQLGRHEDLETLGETIGQADIVAVQEVGVDWFEGAEGNQPQLLSRASGLNHSRFASVLRIREEGDPPVIGVAPTETARPALGLALFSRYPLGPWARHRLPKRQDPEQRCILSGTVVTPKGPISVLVTQLSPNEVDRAAQLPALLRHAQTQSSPLVMMGDLQATAEEMKGLAPFLINAGGDNPGATYPANDPVRSIDHIYLTKELEIIEAARPLVVVGSEHLPVLTRVSL